MRNLTPLTDAVVDFHWPDRGDGGEGVPEEWVPADFARDLERRIAEAADCIKALAALAHKRDCEATYERARADRLDLLHETDARRAAELEGSIVAARTDHLCYEKFYQLEKSFREKAERERDDAYSAMQYMMDHQGHHKAEHQAAIDKARELGKR